MAFLNRVRGLLTQTVSNHGSSKLCAVNPSLFQAIRNMSSSKLFVGGLSYGTDEMSLREEFSKYGEVVEARIIMDRDTGRSRGFAFVTYTSTEAASSAIQAFDGQDLHGRRVRVNFATERERPRDGGFGGGYGGGGGYGSGYGGGQGGNYGGGGYQGGGGGGYGGSDGGFGGVNQYQSGGGGDNYPSGGVSSFGGGDSMSGDGGNYGGSGSNFFSGSQSGHESAGAADQRGTGAENDGFAPDVLDGNDRDVDDEEPKDFANTRG